MNRTRFTDERLNEHLRDAGRVPETPADGVGPSCLRCRGFLA